VPCVVSIGTSIPKARVFRFEDYWIRLPGFLDVVNTIWNINCPCDAAKCLSSKLKLLRKGLKNWSSSFQVLNGLITNCNSVIMMMDDIEEQRMLHISEWNFRNIVKRKLQHLLSCKHEYWKKRCTARWAKLGDENTSFFHSMATIRFQKNTISTLSREDGSVATEHHEKAGLLWHSFKQRLGVSTPISSTFDFSPYLNRLEDLEVMSSPFTNEEIDLVVAHMPNDRSPRPDGFSGFFLKIWWPIIKYDFYILCQEFWDCSVNLQSINNSFITLIPKLKPRSARMISDLFRC
jgi:hypothetical protein